MPRSKEGRDPDWLLPGEGLAALLSAGEQVDRAASRIFQGLKQSAFQGRAREIVTIYPEGGRELREGPVWPGVWTYCPNPPLGSDFWLKGDIDVPHVEMPEGSVIQLAGRVIEMPLGGLLPAFRIRGLHIPAVAMASLEGKIGPQAADRPIGRPASTGPFSARDDMILARMQELRNRGFPSWTAAARELWKAGELTGQSEESAIRRVVRKARKRT